MQRALRHGASFLVSFTVNKGSPTLSPQGGRVLSANSGLDQRIVCACCRGLRPRLRSVSSRLMVCARRLALRARQTDRSRGRRKGIRPKTNSPSCGRRPTTRTHGTCPHGNRPFGEAEPNIAASAARDQLFQQPSRGSSRPRYRAAEPEHARPHAASSVNRCAL